MHIIRQRHFSPLFFFKRYGVHRDLHSFPTRRSSDLIVASFASHVHRVQQVMDAAYEYERKVALIGRSMVDRKSTRLNSSHMSISYAVFCLKKKTGSRRQLRSIKSAACSRD